MEPGHEAIYDELTTLKNAVRRLGKSWREDRQRAAATFADMQAQIDTLTKEAGDE